MLATGSCGKAQGLELREMAVRNLWIGAQRLLEVTQSSKEITPSTFSGYRREHRHPGNIGIGLRTITGNWQIFFSESVRRSHEH